MSAALLRKYCRQRSGRHPGRVIVAIEAAAYSVARDRGVDGRVARLRSSTREFGYDSCFYPSLQAVYAVMSHHTRGTRARSAPPSAGARAVAARARAAASLARRPPGNVAFAPPTLLIFSRMRPKSNKSDDRCCCDGGCGGCSAAALEEHADDALVASSYSSTNRASASMVERWPSSFVGTRQNSLALRGPEAILTCRRPLSWGNSSNRWYCCHGQQSNKAFQLCRHFPFRPRGRLSAWKCDDGCRRIKFGNCIVR